MVTAMRVLMYPLMRPDTRRSVHQKQ